MRSNTLLGAAAACALLATPAAALGAKLDRSDYVGHRLPVRVEQELFYEEVPGSFTGSLQRGQTFKVQRLSPSGTYAYGGVNRHVYVKTAGLDAKASGGSDGGPQLIGTPSVSYAFNRQKGLGRFLTIGAVIRTDRALNRSKYTVITAPKLTPGEDLPGELFGGITPGTIGKKGKHCYLAEAIQDRQHKALNGDRTWRLGLLRHGDVYNGRLKHVTLKRFDDDEGWELKAAKRLGC